VSEVEKAAVEQQSARGLDVRIAHELVERARAEGVSLVGQGGLLRQVTRTVLQTALEAEMADHLGYERGETPPGGSGNQRNGTSAKTVRTEVGDVRLDVPRDRHATFEPKIVPKHARRVEGFDEAIVSLYAKGLTTGGDPGASGPVIYDVEVSRDLVSTVTDRVTEELAAWASRPLDKVYPVVLIDAIHVKIRDGQVANRPVYVAVGVNLAGERDVLGMWVGTGGEGAKHWMTCLAELRNRGVEDVCIVACDGLKGLPDSVTCDLAARYGAVVRGAPGACVAAVCVQGALGADHQGAAHRLHRPHPRGRTRPVRRVRGGVGPAVPGHHQAVAIGVGTVHAVLGVPTRDTPHRLYDERGRVAQRPVPPRHPTAWALPQRTGRAQGALPGDSQPATQPGQRHRQDHWMEEGVERARPVLRRADHRKLNAITGLTHKDPDTPPPAEGCGDGRPHGECQPRPYLRPLVVCL
jgi:putative transposase